MEYRFYLPVVFTIIGWCIVFFISDRSSRRSETRGDFSFISSLLDKLKELCDKRCKVVIEDKSSSFDDSFETSSSSIISRVEMFARRLSVRLDLVEPLIDVDDLSKLRQLTEFEDRNSLSLIYEICEKIEDRLLEVYHAKYYQAFISRYRIELFVTLLYLSSLILITQL